MHTEYTTDRATGFLSTPSARRATWKANESKPSEIISIHALREEGDIWTYSTHTEEIKFLSTPSARRATTNEKDRLYAIAISIHALREEGDKQPRGRQRDQHRFLSTPSARRATTSAPSGASASIDFYPRPPRGGRRYSRPNSRSRKRFLSTPSARRATAKTERKHPAFVSLYTSLHKLQRDACKTNRKITPLLAQTAGIPVRSVPEYHVCCRFALAGHQKISTLSWANSGCSPTCSTLVW